MKRASILAVSALICVTPLAGVVAGQDNEPTMPLQAAARAGDMEQLNAHLARRADLNRPDDLGFTPLYCAVAALQVEATQRLLEAGAYPDARGPGGVTALMVAASAGRKDLVDLLLAKGANVEMRDDRQRTALQSAVYGGQLEIVKALVNGGADVNSGGWGQTPLSIARQMNKVESAEYLQQQGATEAAAGSSYAGYAQSDEQGVSPQGAYERRGGPAQVQIDPNEVQRQLQEFADLPASLAAVDANSASEQRAWVMRRLDNRSSLLSAVQRQFYGEMAFVKGVATEEKGEQTVQAIDGLSATRKERYEAISDALRDQRREMLQQSRSSAGTAYGGRGRASRTTRGAATQGGAAYGGYAQGPTALPGRADPNEPQFDQETQNQIQAWLNTNVGDKQALLDATHALDVTELSALQQVATGEGAQKTAVAVAALMMVREQRIAKIVLKWREDDERAARMQQRLGTQGTQDPMAGRRGRRR